MTYFPNSWFGGMAKIANYGLNVIVQNDGLMLLSRDGSDYLWEDECSVEINVLFILIVQVLELIKYLLGDGSKLFLIINGEHEQSFEGLGLEDEWALTESFEEKVIILSIEIIHFLNAPRPVYYLFSSLW